MPINIMSGAVTPEPTGWDLYWDDSSFSPSLMAVDSNDDVVLVGTPTSGDITIVKVDSAGSKDWERKYSDASDTFTPYALHIDSSDNIYVGGDGTGGPFIIKYNSSGTFQWDKELSFGDVLHAIFVASDGDVLIAYKQNSGGTQNLMKFDPSTFTIDWQVSLTSSKFTNNGVRILEDNSGDFYVVGTRDNGNSSEAAIVKVTSAGAYSASKKWGNGVYNQAHGCFGTHVDATYIAYLVKDGSLDGAEINKVNSSFTHSNYSGIHVSWSGRPALMYDSTNSEFIISGLVETGSYDKKIAVTRTSSTGTHASSYSIVQISPGSNDSMSHIAAELTDGDDYIYLLVTENWQFSTDYTHLIKLNATLTHDATYDRLTHESEESTSVGTNSGIYDDGTYSGVGSITHTLDDISYTDAAATDFPSTTLSDLYG